MTAPLDLVDRKAVQEALQNTFCHVWYQIGPHMTSIVAALPSYPAPAGGAVVPQTIIGVISELEREAASRATGERPRMLAFGTQEIADLLALVQALIAKEAKP